MNSPTEQKVEVPIQSQIRDVLNRIAGVECRLQSITTSLLGRDHESIIARADGSDDDTVSRGILNDLSDLVSKSNENINYITDYMNSLDRVFGLNTAKKL